LAPDPRFALRSPRIGEPVVLFRLPAGLTKLEDVSETYKNLLFHVAMGSFIAQADGTVAAKEREVLEDRIDTSELRPDERARLHANLTWMLEIPPDVGLFRRRLRDAPEGTRHVLGQAALALAAADGVIDPGEIKAIERLYSAIGLPAEGIYADLHALTARSEPVTVIAPGQSENVDYAVPSPPSDDHSVVLDPERVAALVADTAKVSSVLGEIFDDGTDAEEEDFEESLDGEGSDFPGLDAQHAAFLDELLTRPHWDEAEFAALARQFRLMEEGALETVNEWGFEQHNGQLIEVYEGYEINPDIAAELRS
ncbi:MAG: TerB family tellurite resistance protein, partial [Rhodospirillales bacterium]|nr:TerB family tellurite resistance protein [Rhodospirillales bacterium]